MSIASTPSNCDFPLFRAKFLSAAAWTSNSSPDTIASHPGRALAGRDGLSSSVPLETRISNGKVISSLDLSALPRDEGELSELQARREKFAYFEKHCSEIAEGLFLGSDAVARSRETLRDARITHVVNCVGFLYPPYFKDELTYQILFLQDTPGEDITSVLYDVFDFIEAARQSGGRVLVHCSQGVSRSTTLVIAYLMWKQDKPYDDVFQAVKAARGVANPNIGFTCQLLNWHKRRTGPPEPCRVYRMAPHSSSAPLFLVPKPVQAGQSPLLDPRAASVIHTPDHVYVWQGARCLAAMTEAATKAAEGLIRYENAAGPPVMVAEGSEPLDLASALRSAAGNASSPLVGECEAYTKEYQICEQAAARAASGSGSAPNSGRQSKTPREAPDEDGSESPNHRSRKIRRGDADDSSTSSPSAPASPSPT